MALKLILGNSGSGKTEYMYEQVVRAAEEDIDYLIYYTGPVTSILDLFELILYVI